MFLTTASSASTFAANDREELRNFLLTEAGTLVLGSNTTLRRLAADLSELQRVTLLEGQVSRLLVGDPGGTYSGKFLACLDLSCVLLDVDDITMQSWKGRVLNIGEANSHGLFVAGRDGQSVLTVALRNELQPSIILRGNIIGVGTDDQIFMRLARQFEENSLLFREFLTVFENGGFSYYIYHNNVISTFPTETRFRFVST